MNALASNGVFRTLPALALALGLAACGARTGLEAPGPFGARDGDPSRGPALVRTPRDALASNLGTEFWAVCTPNSFLPASGDFHFAIVVGNPGDEPASIVIDGGALRTPRTFVVPARSVRTEVVPWVLALGQNSLRPSRYGEGGIFTQLGLTEEVYLAQSARVENGAYRVRSSVPVVASQFNPLEFETRVAGMTLRSYTNDASLLLPTSALGTRHRVLTYDDALLALPDFIAVTATRDGTEVRVTPTQELRTGPGVARTLGAGTTHAFTLAAGEVLLLASAGERGAELTGSVVESSAPVAVHAGVDCTTVGGVPACDHLEEQLPAVSAWGRGAIVVPFADRDPAVAPTVVRVLADRAGTEVRVTDRHGVAVRSPRTLGAGEFITFTTDAPRFIEATQPVLVAQYMVGQGETMTAEAASDPAMMLVPSREQFRNTYAFATPATYTENYADVTFPTGTAARVDGTDIRSQSEPIEGTPWSVAHLSLAPGGHIVEADAPEGALLSVYGVASYTSYAFSGGMNLAPASP